ncbi:ComEC/Rec2 family competence protein [Pontibacter chitinilyticus]|uniref:ComEC/Rec2 family competence protein n=1 Tax=Pontibacter chitinilyticus TaxID=2674989 RepID=UPI0032193160
MLRWAPYPFIRITLSFIAGILLYFYVGKDFSYSAEVFAFFVGLYLFAWLLARKYKAPQVTDAAGILGLLCFMAGGFWVTQLHTEQYRPQHLLHLAEQPAHYLGVIDDYVVQKAGYQRTVMQVRQVQVNGQWQTAEGKVELTVPHDSERPYELTYGDVLLVKGSPERVAPPANPEQFDYRSYLANKGIYYRHYLKPHQYQKIAFDPSWSLLYRSMQLRRHLDALLRQQIRTRREYGISSALLLGVKDDLDNSIRQAYANTGTMHVLAVSGLHVGLIYIVLMLLLSRFNRSSRQRVLGALLVLGVLWLYAFVTGLSPSVLRAVVMFSLVTVGLALQRRTSIYNTIAFAAWVLLLLNPYYLLDVGFQLSFLAVLGIVYLQPKLYSLLELNAWLPEKLWALFTVSVAAQVATLPLGLYYFHQFPVYFWLANMVVVPLAMLVLYSGMLAVAVSWVPWLGSLLFGVHQVLVYIMNDLNLWMQQWPAARINGISISGWQTLLLYALLVLFLLFLTLKQLRFLVLAAVLVAIFSVQQMGEVLAQRQQHVLAIYSLRRASGMALVQGQSAVLLADSALRENDAAYTYNIQPHFWRLGVEQPQFASFTGSVPRLNARYTLLPDSNSLLVWHGQRILLLSHPPTLRSKAPLQLDYLLLRHNVRLKPQDIQHYTFRKLVVDGSSSLWYRQRLRQQLDTLGLAYYDVADSGALVLKTN